MSQTAGTRSLTFFILVPLQKNNKVSATLMKKFMVQLNQIDPVIVTQHVDITRN